MPYVIISLRHGKKKQNVGSYVSDEIWQTNEGRSKGIARERCPRAEGEEEMNTQKHRNEIDQAVGELQALFGFEPKSVYIKFAIVIASAVKAMLTEIESHQ